MVSLAVASVLITDGSDKGADPCVKEKPRHWRVLRSQDTGAPEYEDPIHPTK